MGRKSQIEWTDTTWNPVTGCTKVGPDCDNCDAERFAERWRGVPGHPYEHQGGGRQALPLRQPCPDKLQTHLDDFIAAYDYARRLKTLNGLTPYGYICKIWTTEPNRLRFDPVHQMPGPNT